MAIETRYGRLGAFLVAMPLGLTAAAAAAGETSTNLANGAALTIGIADPETGTEFKIPAATVPGDTIDVDVTGFASIGEGAPAVTLITVIDVSASAGANCGGGLPVSILDCEKQAALNLLNDPATASVFDYGIAAFANGSLTGDMQPGGGGEPLTTSNGQAQSVVNSAFAGTNGGLGLFTNKQVLGNSTNFEAGVAALNTIAGESSQPFIVAAFLSDGRSLRGNLAAVLPLVPSNVTIFTFAVGAGSSCGGSPTFGTLNEIAAAGSGQGMCTFVPDPSHLPDILPDVLGTMLTTVTLQGNEICAPTDCPQDGPTTFDFVETLPDLGPGDKTFCAAASGFAALDEQAIPTVEQCETIHVLQLIATPPTETNELGVDNEHTVFARILGPIGQPARNVEVEVISGPNLGQSDADTATVGVGQVSLAYQNPNQDTSGLGMDTIRVCTEIPDGSDMASCVELEKNWVDTIPPEPSCTETVNPHGNTIPPAGGTPNGGQNPDGFYQLGATDLVSAPDEITIEAKDLGSDMVLGTFAVGDNIKYTQAPGGKPGSKQMGSGNGQAGAIVAHLTGNGDLEITATDSEGNAASITCLVPPPPK